MKIFKGTKDDVKLLQEFCQKVNIDVDTFSYGLDYSKNSLEGVYFITENNLPMIVCLVRPFRDQGIRIHGIYSTMDEDSLNFIHFFKQFLAFILYKYSGQDNRMLFCFTKSDHILRIVLNEGFEIHTEMIQYRKKNCTVPEFNGLPVKIRPFWEEDVDKLIELEKGIFMPEFWNSRENFYQMAQNANAKLFVAYFMGQVVGYNYNRIIENTEGHLVRIGVHQDYQGLGIGKQLLKRAIEWFVEKDISSIMLNVKRDNLSARILYEQFGFIKEEGIEYILFYEGSRD